jgi:hypothetical protein
MALTSHFLADKLIPLVDRHAVGELARGTPHPLAPALTSK